MEENPSVHTICAVSIRLDGQSSNPGKRSQMRTATWMRHNKSLLYVKLNMATILDVKTYSSRGTFQLKGFAYLQDQFICFSYYYIILHTGMID